jgi:fumarate hydratase subunit beta
MTNRIIQHSNNYSASGVATIHVPLRDGLPDGLQVGDLLSLNGLIYTGRDAVLPKIVQMCEDGTIDSSPISLRGTAVFHTAVSPAGIGPTSSNKAEIESSIPLLSKYGVKIHLGKGAISTETVQALKKYQAMYAVVPPISAFLASTILSKKIIAFEEEGMEALHLIEVKNFPAIAASLNGVSLYDTPA